VVVDVVEQASSNKEFDGADRGTASTSIASAARPAGGRRPGGSDAGLAATVGLVLFILVLVVGTIALVVAVNRRWSPAKAR
jgi:hypothetical protein